MSKLTDEFRRKLEAVQSAYYGSQDEPREAADNEMWAFWGEVGGLLKMLSTGYQSYSMERDMLCYWCDRCISRETGDIPHDDDCPVMAARQLLARLEE